MESLDEVIEKFVGNTSKLIDLEQEAERQQLQELFKRKNVDELEKAGICLTKLSVVSVKSGLFNKYLIAFVDQRAPAPTKAPVDGEAVRHQSRIGRAKLSSGDIVGVYEPSEALTSKPLLSGVVYRVKSSKIVVSFDDLPEMNLEGIPLTMALLANDVTYRRYKDVLGGLKSAFGDAHHHSNFMLRVCFGLESPTAKNPNLDPRLRRAGPMTLEDLKTVDKTLNDEQKTAVLKSLNAETVTLVHGPPGTGKTKTIVEFITQCAAAKMKVLACAGSNIAVDNMVERLAKNKVRLCRVGHPARLLHSIIEHSLDSLLAKTDAHKNIKKLNKEIKKLQLRLGKLTKREEKNEIRTAVYQLLKEIKEFYRIGLKEVFEEVDVILATNTGAGDKHVDRFIEALPRKAFDVVVVDECAQSLEISCWIPLLRAPKVVLAGDHKQLPPTIKSKEAEKSGLSVTLFDRLQQLYGDKVSQLLRVQYRMNHKIMEWSSQSCYEGKLLADASVRDHSLRDFESNASEEQTEIFDSNAILLLIDTCGANMGESLGEEGGNNYSKSNEGEAALVALLFREMVNQGIASDGIGIIAPYNAQVELIRKELEAQNASVEVSTVDGFQGREKEVIIISMVRSNPEGSIGFLAEYRRMNVAVTRAKRFVALVCDSETVSHDPFLKVLVDYFRVNGDVRSATELTHLSEQLHFNTGYYGKKKGKPEERKHEEKGTDKTKEKRDPKKKKKTKGKDKKEEEKDDIVEIEPVSMKKVHDEDANAKSEAEVERIISQVKALFRSASVSEFRCPAGINSYQRMRLHERAEELGFGHKSEGVGELRTLVIFKQVVNEDKEGANEVQQPVKPSVAEEEKKEVVPIAKQRVVEEEKKESAPPPKPKKEVKPPKKKDDRKKKEEDMDDDAYLDEMIKRNKFCSFESDKGQCDKNVELFGLACKYCNRRFCMPHLHAELHGCGDRASIIERREFREEYNRTSSGLKPLSENDKYNLTQKLHSKMASRSEHKGTKKKEEEKKGTKRR